MEEIGSALKTMEVMLQEIRQQQEEDVLGKSLDQDLKECNASRVIIVHITQAILMSRHVVAGRCRPFHHKAEEARQQRFG